MYFNPFHHCNSDQIPMTLRMHHVFNESRQEAGDAIIRILLPRPVQFVNTTDTQICNITNYNFTENHYLDFSVKFCNENILK